MASKELIELSIANAPKNTIPAETVGSVASPLPIAQPIDETNDRTALMAETQGAINQIEGDLKLTRARQTSEEQAAERLIRELGGRESYTSQVENKFGLPELESQLSNINAQISAENRLAPARLLQAQKDAEGTGLTTSSLSTRLSNRERDNAIRSMVLAAEADIVQGRVDAANTRITRAIDAKFKPMENELELRKFNLERVDEKVKAGDIKLSNERERKYKQQISKIEKEEQEIEDRKRSIQDITKAVSLNGAPAAVIDDILKAENVEDALRAASPYLKDPMLDIDRALKQAQLNKINAEIAAMGQESSSSGMRFRLADGREVERAEYEKVLNLAKQLKTVQGHPDKVDNILGAVASWIPRTGSKDFRGEVDRLKNLLTVDNLDLMSGVLSESDIQILQSAATSLSLGQSTEQFNRELSRIQSEIEKSLGADFFNPSTEDDTIQITEDGNLMINAPIGETVGGMVGSTSPVGDNVTFFQEIEVWGESKN